MTTAISLWLVIGGAIAPATSVGGGDRRGEGRESVVVRRGRAALSISRCSCSFTLLLVRVAWMFALAAPAGNAHRVRPRRLRLYWEEMRGDRAVDGRHMALYRWLPADPPPAPPARAGAAPAWRALQSRARCTTCARSSSRETFIPCTR